MSKPNFTYQAPVNYQWEFSTWASIYRLAIIDSTKILSSFILGGSGVDIPIIDKKLKYTRVLVTNKNDTQKERIAIAGVFKS